LIIVLVPFSIHGQITDSIPEIEGEGLDSINVNDTLPKTEVISLDEIDVSKETLSDEVEYGADSIDFDNGAKVVHLYENAYVNYTDLKLTAAYIRINFDENEAIAEPRPDSTGEMAGIPHFVQGTQEFDAQRLRYNFKTKKGYITEVRTQYNDTYILGTKTKYVSADSDSTGQVEEDHINFKSAIFTTCNHPHPHFGIRSSKIKVVPNKVVVVGPSQVEIAGVPTPLFLPFAFFPLKQGKRTGLIFPRDYEYSPAWGFGLNNVGWYFPISEYVDLIATADIYTRGRWGINLNSRYRKRYKYSGSFTFNYSKRSVEAVGDFRRNVEESYRISLRHNQDANAHPTRTIGGNLNLTFNNFDRINRNDAASVLDNTLSSNFTFSQRFPSKPYSLSASLSHSQNTRSRRINISFPNLDFRVRQIQPFKRKGGVGKERWYEKINVQYNMALRNRFEGSDTTFFSQQTLDDAQFGIRQNINTNASFRVLKYFNLTPSVQYSEVWYWKTIRKDFDPTLQVEIVDSLIDLDGNVIYVRDTTFGTRAEEDRNVGGFEPFRTISTSLSLNTQIFGTMQFRKGWLRGIRHVIKPTVSLNFAPDYLSQELGYYLQQDSDTREAFNNPSTYSIFEGGIFGSPPRSGQQTSLSYS
ncbi:MAG: putative LPS assembly protein LptD, partial [Bacteroidota bacterium]